MKYRRCQGRFPSRLLWWACVGVWIDVVAGGELRVKFGVLLPEHPVDRTMHPCTTVAEAMAEEWLIAEDLAALNWIVDGPTLSKDLAQGGKTTTTAIRVQFDYENSQCSDSYGPFHAMEIYYHGAGCRIDKDSKAGGIESLDVPVFYGPCCKYALAPVGRYAKIWGVPLITPGGLTSRFASSADFSMLTRFIAPYAKVVEFLWTLLAKYNWWHLSLLFHDNLGPDKVKGYPMCYDLMEAVTKVMDRSLKRRVVENVEINPTAADNDEQEDTSCCVIHREIFNENYYDIYDFDELMDLIRNASRGKCSRHITRTVMKVNPTDLTDIGRI